MPCANIDVFIALGGNLAFNLEGEGLEPGERAVLATFQQALSALQSRAVQPLAVSAAYRTQAWVQPGQTAAAPNYWNAVCHGQTTLSPTALLDTLLHVETMFGRQRRRPWAARTLDLDLLLYGQQRIDSQRLQVPHRGIFSRPFVLQPLMDLNPALLVPGDDRMQTVAELLAGLANPQEGILERLEPWLDRSF